MDVSTWILFGLLSLLFLGGLSDFLRGTHDLVLGGFIVFGTALTILWGLWQGMWMLIT